MIAPSRSRLSYRDRRSHQKQRFRHVGVALAAVAVYLAVTHLAAAPYRVDSVSLEPTFPPGTRLLVHGYLIRSKDGGLSNPPSRGDVVAIKPPYVAEDGWGRKILNPLVRLVTFQKASLGAGRREGWENPVAFKRVIGIPGDTVHIIDSVAYVRPAGETYFLSEFETSGRGYDITVPQSPEGWTDSLPLSGAMADLTLGPGQYFVLGDNRGASNDSRYWGPLSERDVRGRVLAPYWPLRILGKPR